VPSVMQFLVKTCLNIRQGWSVLMQEFMPQKCKIILKAVL